MILLLLKQGIEGCCILGFWIHDMLLTQTWTYLNGLPSHQMSHMVLSKWVARTTLNITQTTWRQMC